MQISAINTYSSYIYKNKLTDRQNFVQNRPFGYVQQAGDSFQSSAINGNCSKVSFTGDFFEINRRFEEEFPKSFFRKLANEHLPCAYTGHEMISITDYEQIKSSQVLQKRAALAVKFLKSYKKSFSGVEKKVFAYFELEAKKHPNMKLQELLKLKYDSAEKSLVAKQSQVLDKMSFISRELNKNDYMTMRKFINRSFDKIFEPNPLPEDRFRRKDFIMELLQTTLSDEEIKTKLIETAKKLPRSTDSVNAFIVKYSQPYKIKYENGNIVKTVRDSEEVGLRLLQPYLATDEHIYPQKLYKEEEKERIDTNKSTQIRDDYRVTVLTCAFINNLKEDKPLDEFIKTSEYDIPKNVQNHVDKLIKVAEVWMKKGQIEDSAKLAKYILVLKNEFELRSKIVKIDITPLEKILPDIKYKYENRSTKHDNKVIKPKSRSDNADNSHKEVYFAPNGIRMENRKKQKHSSRFHK